MIFGEVEHVELKVRHFKEAQFWKWHFFEYYDLIDQQPNVGYTFKLAGWQILSKYTFDVKIKSSVRFDTCHGQPLQNDKPLQNDVKIQHGFTLKVRQKCWICQKTFSMILTCLHDCTNEASSPYNVFSLLAVANMSEKTSLNLGCHGNPL